ncbi:MAG: hypothetical protein NVSMB12_21560 [Acidimicrobiales bacterium]
MARPPSSSARDATRTGIILAHGFPRGPGAGTRAAQTFPELAERVAADTGWAAMAVSFRGAGGSPGAFSPGGWLEDLCAAVAFLRSEVSTVWLAGFGFGGVLVLRAAATDPEIGGVAVLATPTDLGEWVDDPSLLADAAYEAGILPGGSPVADVSSWAADLRELDPLGSARAIPPRPLLIVHGSADDEVPLMDARALHDAVEGEGDLRVIARAGHGRLPDPRASALLLGWLERREAAR